MDIDKQTHADIVEFIEAEMYRVCKADCDDTGAADRLASLIEGRLGHETPKKALFPGITQGEWYPNEYIVGNEKMWRICKEKFETPLAQKIRNTADAKLIVAAPKFGELLAKLHSTLRPGFPLEPVEGISHIMDESLKVLREAGAEI